MTRTIMPILGSKTIKSIPWAMIEPHDTQARANHNQTLDRLAGRGGVGVGEALDIMAGNRWDTTRCTSEAEEKLTKLVAEWQKMHGDYTDTQRLDFMITQEAWVAWNREGDACRVFASDDTGGPNAPIVGWGPDKWSPTGRAAIDAAMKVTK